MKIAEMMTTPVKVCGQGESLQEAARMMWEGDCGFVAVVDDAGALVGTLTDRDICMAGYIQGKRLAEIQVSEVAPRVVLHVSEGDGVEVAENIMRAHRVHRVPVVDASGKLVGIVSVSDFARHAMVPANGKKTGASADGLAQTLVAISRPHGAPQPVAVEAPRIGVQARANGVARSSAGAANDS